jgi:hypothetical protein
MVIMMMMMTIMIIVEEEALESEELKWSRITELISKAYNRMPAMGG